VDEIAALLTAADRVEALKARTTPGDWRPAGLLASRPEVVAHHAEGGTEHVAEARALTGAWIAAFSPALAGPLVELLRGAATRDTPDPAVVTLARTLLDRLP